MLYLSPVNNRLIIIARIVYFFLIWKHLDDCRFSRNPYSSISLVKWPLLLIRKFEINRLCLTQIFLKNTMRPDIGENCHMMKKCIVITKNCAPKKLVGYREHVLWSKEQDLGIFPRSALICSQRAGKVFVNSSDGKTKWEWKLRNFSVKLKFSTTHPSWLPIYPQRSVANCCAESDSLLSKFPWEGSMEEKGVQCPKLLDYEMVAEYCVVMQAVLRK